MQTLVDRPGREELGTAERPAAPRPHHDDAPVARRVAGPTLAHQPSLDGLRGLAVAAVVGYHLGWGWMRGGFLGVSLFFTLSGFLITNLLLAERAASGTIRLRSFWARRARRLLPAALAGVMLALLFAALAGRPEQLSHLPGDVMAAAGYAANWRFILGHSTYQAGYLAPSPLLHYWSLAIEEQLYIFLPLIVLFVTRRRRNRAHLAAVVTALLAASAAATVVLGRTDPNRVYFGTDTRMFELLAGVLLAVAVGFPDPAGRAGRRSRATTVAGLLLLAATVGLWSRVAETDHWLYRGGLWGVALLSCGLILVAFESGPVSALLRRRVLAGLGRVSYGVYVYHWPMFLLLDSQRTGLRGPALDAVRLGATAVVTAASYRLVEQPIRQRRWHFPRPALVLSPALPVGAVAFAVLLAGQASSRAVVAAAHRPIVLRAATGPATTGSPAVTGPPPAPPPPLTRVLFVGDSLVQQAFPTFADRLKARGVQAQALGGPGQSLMTHQAAWLGELQQAVSAFDPDVVVLESCCGQFATESKFFGPDGRPVSPDTPAFYAEWRQLASRASVIASRRGAAVLWVLGPPTHTNGWYGPIDRRVPLVNAVYRSILACAPTIGGVDWEVVTNPDGSYADALPNVDGQLVRVRLSDGFHFTPAGIDILADLTLPAIDRQWATDGGRSGAWDGSCRSSGDRIS